MERMLPLLSPAFKSAKGVEHFGQSLSPCELSSLHAADSSDGGLLVLGQRRTCRTSLLFQAGVTAAQEGLHVTFVRPEPLSSLPLQVHGMPGSDPESLSLLSMRYYSTAKELTDYLGSLHANPTLPDLLIVDDLHIYLQLLHQENGYNGDPYEILARLCCLLEDAADFISTKSHIKSCQMIVSSCDPNPMHLPIYKKYFKNMVTVNATGGSGSSYSMSWPHKESRVVLGLQIQGDSIVPSNLDVNSPPTDVQK